MPVFVKLCESSVPIAYKLTDTMCITGEATYECTQTYAPECSTDDMVSSIISHVGSGLSRTTFLCIGNGELNAANALINAIFPRGSPEEVVMSAAEVRGDELLDVFRPESQVTIARDDGFAYKAHGWSSVSLAVGRSLLEGICQVPRILHTRGQSCEATIIELPCVGAANTLLLSLSKLVTLILAYDGQNGMYFPYRDSAITKLLWHPLFCAPSKLVVLLFCLLDVSAASDTALLLQLGDQLLALREQSNSMPFAVNCRSRSITGTNIARETEILTELFRELKQLRADANAAEYAKRQIDKENRAKEQKRQHGIKIRTLEAKLASLESERKRKAELLAYKKRQYSEVQHADSPIRPGKHIRAELETAGAILDAIKRELLSNKRLLAAALKLTDEERNRGNIRQAEFNLRSLKAHWKAITMDPELSKYVERQRRASRMDDCYLGSSSGLL